MDAIIGLCHGKIRLGYAKEKFVKLTGEFGKRKAIEIAQIVNAANCSLLNLESLVGESGEGGRSLRGGAADGAGDSLWEVRLLRDAILKK
jgi:hypothetical protein